MSKDKVWADDLVIQAISEIYNKPIEIFVDSSEPIKCFHEDAFKNNFGTKLPIRLSQHYSSHYNSIRKILGGEQEWTGILITEEIEENNINDK